MGEIKNLLNEQAFVNRQIAANSGMSKKDADDLKRLRAEEQRRLSESSVSDEQKPKKRGPKPKVEIDATVT